MVSTWLETRAGHCVTYGLVSIATVTAIVLQVMTNAKTVFTVNATGICAITAMGMSMFWVCGKSLMQAIDASLEKQRQQQQQLEESSAAGSKKKKSASGGEIQIPQKFSTGDLNLLAAKQKVKKVLAFVMGLGWIVECFLIFDAISGYGASAPLVFLVAPLAMADPIWYGVNIQVHAGRSNGGRRNPCRRVTLPTNTWKSLTSSSLVGTGIRHVSTYRNSKQILPTEVPTETPC